MELYQKIKSHKGVVTNLVKKVNAYKTFISELEAYLNLPKFSQDTTVNKADIFLRIEELKQELSRNL